MDLHIAKTQASPEVAFDPDQRILRITGESYPENSFDFYAPVLDWLTANLPSLPSLRLEVSVSYMNSSSIKCMLDILDAVGEAYTSGKDVSAVWNYETDNPRALDLAEEFRSEVAFPFTVIAIGA
jgi:SiaC family regulatory phosphoprotein